MTWCQAEKTLRHDFFSRVGGVVRQGVETTIRERVRGLFKSRADLSQREFADALGVDPSWVSAFLAGRRPANDIHLLVKIARYFGVSVGYLLDETERGLDAGAMTLIATWEHLDPADRSVVLTLALNLRRRGDTPAVAPPHAPRGGSDAEDRDTPARGPKSRAKTLR